MTINKKIEFFGYLREMRQKDLATVIGSPRKAISMPEYDQISWNESAYRDVRHIYRSISLFQH